MARSKRNIDPKLFVSSLFDNGGNVVEAYISAGGGQRAVSRQSIQISANAFKRKPEVRALIEEEKVFRATGEMGHLLAITPLAIQTRKDILQGYKTVEGKRVKYEWDDKTVASAANAHIKDIQALIPKDHTVKHEHNFNAQVSLEDLVGQLEKVLGDDSGNSARVIEGTLVQTPDAGSDDADKSDSGEASESGGESTQPVHALPKAEGLS